MAEFEHGKQITATDPVCGMELPLEQAAAQEEHEGWAYFFCSQDCHRLFRNAPERMPPRRAGPSR